MWPILWIPSGITTSIEDWSKCSITILSQTSAASEIITFLQVTIASCSFLILTMLIKNSISTSVSNTWSVLCQFSISQWMVLHAFTSLHSMLQHSTVDASISRNEIEKLYVFTQATEDKMYTNKIATNAVMIPCCCAVLFACTWSLISFCVVWTFISTLSESAAVKQWISRYLSAGSNIYHHL